jgi:ABC-type Na+ efflux pump permease subunit
VRFEASSVIFWRELREALADRAFIRRSVFSIIALPALLFILDIKSAAPFVLATATPSLLMAGVTGGAFTWSVTLDSFVGERDRKTLETLLATPVSLLELLGGKVAANVAVAMVYSLLSFFLVAVGLQVSTRLRGLVYAPSPWTLGRMVVVIAMLSVLMVEIMVVISSQSRSTRAAQAVLVFPFTAVYFPTIIWGARLISLPAAPFILVLILGFALIVGLLVMASGLFRSERLLLEAG